MIEYPDRCTITCKSKCDSTPYSVSRARHHSSSSVKSAHDVVLPLSFPRTNPAGSMPERRTAILIRACAICRHAISVFLIYPGMLYRFDEYSIAPKSGNLQARSLYPRCRRELPRIFPRSSCATVIFGLHRCALQLAWPRNVADVIPTADYAPCGWLRPGMIHRLIFASNGCWIPGIKCIHHVFFNSAA